MTTRAFVVGTGPSLARVDLDLLIGETSYACNRIHLEYGRTKWRPDAWFLMDQSRNSKCKDDVIFHYSQGYKCYIDSDIIYELFPGWRGPTSFNDDEEMKWYDFSNVEIIFNCQHKSFVWHPAKAWHLPHICHFGGGVSGGIQKAILDGHKEIYLLGCDLGYKEGNDNHCHSNYIDDPHTKESAELRNKTLLLAHEIALRESRELDVRIFNATPGGHLEVYPRVSLEEIL